MSLSSPMYQEHEVLDGSPILEEAICRALVDTEGRVWLMIKAKKGSYRLPFTPDSALSLGSKLVLAANFGSQVKAQKASMSSRET